ncbi:MAG: hypothetical protein AAF329_10005 [Cyanobacteria bacterium P01_A01_bin.17]
MQRIKTRAAANKRSMEQEVRQLLETRYASRKVVVDRICERWSTLPETVSDEVDQWRETGRRSGVGE